MSLDRLYSVKSALSSYSKTRSPMRLEDAVDELRRYILANNGMKVTKADLLRSYDWLNVKPFAIADLDRMYKRAYGGSEQIGGIAGMATPTVPVIPEPVIKSEFEEDLDAASDYSNDDNVPYTTVQFSKPPSPRGPALKLHTDFTNTPAISPSNDNSADSTDAASTIKPVDELTSFFHVEDSSPISRIPESRRLGSFLLSADQESVQFGPLTPNGYDDISPITRGEWGFLMIDDAFQGRKTVAVETC